MKKVIIIILILIFSESIISFGKPNQRIKNLQDSALNFYMQNDFENSVRVYLEILKSGYYSSELYYNLGNAYFKSGDIASAIYYYEKAKLHNPSDPDINHNLKIAYSQIKNKVEPLPEFFFISWYKQTLNLFSANTWAVLSIMFFVFLLTAILIYLFGKTLTQKKIGFYTGIIFIFFFSLSLLFSIKQTNNITKNKFAIIFDPVMVKSSPQEEGTNMFEINEGLKVEILDSLNNWYNIRLADGKQGWIVKESVKKL